MKKIGNQAKTGAREESLEALLHQVLREDGKVFPTTEEDVRNLAAEIDEDKIEPIDPARLLARVRGEKAKGETKIVPLFGEVPKQVEDAMLAMAARNGGELTEDVRRQMAQDRAEAEKRLDEQGNQ